MIDDPQKIMGASQTWLFDRVGPRFVPTPSDHLERQYFLEWKRGVSLGKVFPRFETNEAGTMSRNDWRDLPRAKLFSRFLGRSRCWDSKGRKKGLQWGQNNVIVLPVTSFCVPLTRMEHLLCDGHCANSSEPGTGSFHVQLPGELRSTHNAMRGFILLHSCRHFQVFFFF